MYTSHSSNYNFFNFASQPENAFFVQSVNQNETDWHFDDYTPRTLNAARMHAMSLLPCRQAVRVVSVSRYGSYPVVKDILFYQAQRR